MKREELTREMMKIAEDALEASRVPGSGRDEFDAHAAAHRAAEMLSEQDVDEAMPSRSEVREKLGGGLIQCVVRASKKRPRFENNLLRALEDNQVVPEELIQLFGGRLVRRSHLYASEQGWLAEAKEAEQKKATTDARYERALANPFVDWEARELAKGRPRSETKQLTFWLEDGHIATPPPSSPPDEPEGRFGDMPPPPPPSFDPATGEIFEPAE